MPRPVWFEASTLTEVADLLDQAAESAKGPLRFEPVSLPGTADLKLLHQAALLRARRALSESNTESDRILAQEVRAIDDLVRTANLLVERLREWYALHAPEATRLVTDARELATLVAEKGDRTAVLAALDQAALAEGSLGTELDPADLEVLQGFARALAAVHASWTQLEGRVTQLMDVVAPNVASVVGPVIGARMISLSGGLARLATWPAGTVQLLGAETALFRHLKEGTRSPKHGILFQHPSVHQASPWNRGAVARALALAASTGAKADAFTRNDLKAHLAAQLASDMERIAKRKPKPKPAFNPRFQKGPRGPSYGRGPPARDGPRDGGFRGPPRDGPRDGGFRGPPRDGPRPGGYGGPPRDGGFRGPPRDGGYGGPRRDAQGDGGFRGPPRDGDGGFRGPPRDGGYSGPRRDAQGDGGFRGPPREGPRDGGFRGPPRDGDGGSRGPPRDGAGKPFRRKPQGAFRSDNKPARPPGKGGDQ